MARKIGSLFWEIEAKTDKFEKGLKGSKDRMTQFKSGVGDVVQGLTGFSMSTLGAVGAVIAIGNAVKDAVKRFGDYAEQIRTLTALTGTGAEETSRLMQAFDDMGISAEEFSGILESSARKGFVFTLENVKKLSDEYNALGTQAEKNALLQENLGRGATKAAKAFAEGSVAIEGYYNAVSDGQALTEAEIANAEKLRKNLDRLGDEWDSLALTVGGTVAGAINDVVDRSEKMKIVMEETGLQLNAMSKEAVDAALKNYDLAKSEEWVRENAREAKEMLNGYGKEAGDVLPGQLEEAAAAQDLLNNSLKEYNNQLLFTIASEGLSTEAALQLASGLGLVDEKTRYAIAKTGEWKKEVEMGLMTIDQYNAKVWDLAHGLAGITSKDVRVVVETWYVNHNVGSRSEIGGKMSGEVEDNGSGGSGRAAGGPVAAGVPYTVGERGVETFVPNQDGYIVPHGESMGAITINVYGNTDPKRTAEMVMTELRRARRN